MEHGLNIERTVSELHEVWRFDGSRALGLDFWQEMHKLAGSTPADAASVTLDGGDQFGVGTDLAWLSRGSHGTSVCPWDAAELTHQKGFPMPANITGNPTGLGDTTLLQASQASSLPRDRTLADVWND